MQTDANVTLPNPTSSREFGSSHKLSVCKLASLHSTAAEPAKQDRKRSRKVALKAFPARTVADISVPYVAVAVALKKRACQLESLIVHKTRVFMSLQLSCGKVVLRHHIHSLCGGEMPKLLGLPKKDCPSLKSSGARCLHYSPPAFPEAGAQ